MKKFENANLTEEKIYDILKTVIDPELGINIIDLGLVYKIEYNEVKGIDIEVTLSTKACPMGDVIMNNITASIKEYFPNEKLNLLLVWEPKWSTAMVTQEGRDALGFNTD